MQVTLIEDDKYLANSLGNHLEFEGIKVNLIRRARDLEDNIANIKNSDIVILDLIMRRGSIKNDTYETGEHLYEQIKAVHPEKKIIIVSAKNKNELSSQILIDDIKKKHTPYVQKALSADFKELKVLLKNQAK